MSGPPPFSYRPPGMPGMLGMPPGMPPRPYGYGPPPMGMMMPRPGGYLPNGPPPMAMPYGMPPQRPMMPPAPVAKATTVYVGKIAASVEDRVIRQLLDACGAIKSWKLMKDPDSDAHKGFGFCDFHDAEGVLRAVRLLNWLSLDGQELLLKPNTATDKYLEQYQRDKEQRAMERAEARVMKAIRQEEEKKRAQQEQDKQQEQQEQQAKQEKQAADPMEVDWEERLEKGQQAAVEVDGQEAAVKQEGQQEGQPEQQPGDAAEVKQEEGNGAGPASNGDAAVKQELKEESAPATTSKPALPQLQPPPRPKPLLPLADELEEGEDPLAAQKAADEKALATIHAIVKPRDATRAANAEATNEVLAAAGLVLPPPPGAASAGPHVDGAMASVSERGHSAERGRERSRERSKDRSSGRERHGSRGRSKREEGADAPAAVEVVERKLAEAFDADRERARREEEARKRADDARYERKLKELESRERTLVRDRERDKDRLRDAAKERERHMRADLEAVESDDEAEPWQRRPIRHSRRADERRKRRMWEERDDAADRAKDETAAREEAKLRERLEQEQQQQQQGEQEGDERSVKRARLEGQQAGAPPAQQQEEAMQHTNTFNSAPHVPDDDPIYRAMVAAAQQPASQASPAADLQPSVAAQQQHQQQQQRSSRLVPGGGRPKRAVLALFGDEEEGEQKRRKLVPIQYTDEELRAVQEPDPSAAQEATAAASASAVPEDGKAVLRRIMDSIPVSREGVHQYSLKWDTWDGAGTAAAAAAAAGGGVRSKVSKWVSKKVAELLGAEEPDLVAFIMGLLDSRSTPQKVEDEVGAILDNEAAAFTLKLYRLLIYETEKAALGLP